MSPCYCKANLFCWLLGDNTRVPKGFSVSVMFQSPTFCPLTSHCNARIMSVEDLFGKCVECCCLARENVEHEQRGLLHREECGGETLE